MALVPPTYRAELPRTREQSQAKRKMLYNDVSLPSLKSSVGADNHSTAPADDCRNQPKRISAAWSLNDLQVHKLPPDLLKNNLKSSNSLCTFNIEDGGDETPIALTNLGLSMQQTQITASSAK